MSLLATFSISTSPRVFPIRGLEISRVPSPEQALGLPEAGVGTGGGPGRLEHVPDGDPVLLRVVHEARPRLRGSGGGGPALAALVTHNNFSGERASYELSYYQAIFTGFKCFNGPL